MAENSDLKSRLRAARLDPAAVFASPEAVRDAADLTTEEKIEILRRWAYDDADLAVALEEGMPSARTNDLERRVFEVLHELAPELGVERTGPSKQHGLSKPGTPAAPVRNREPDR